MQGCSNEPGKLQRSSAEDADVIVAKNLVSLSIIEIRHSTAPLAKNSQGLGQLWSCNGATMVFGSHLHCGSLRHVFILWHEAS